MRVYSLLYEGGPPNAAQLMMGVSVTTVLEFFVASSAPAQHTIHPDHQHSEHSAEVVAVFPVRDAKPSGCVPFGLLSFSACWANDDGDYR